VKGVSKQLGKEISCEGKLRRGGGGVGSSFESRNLEMDDRRRSLRRVYLSISLF